jgi:ABC-2 type transport system ATP-binding protein
MVTRPLTSLPPTIEVPACPAVAIRGVSYAYPARPAVVDLSLDVQPGEIVALVGPNGGGKSTLMRLIATLVPLQQGTIEVFGQDVMRQPGAVRRRLGVVFQAPSLDRKLTVVENIRLQAVLYGLRGPVITRRVAELLEQFALAERAHERVEHLSGGLRRRVELAKGLIHDPQLLLLDEPSTGLDPIARRDLWSHLRRLRDTLGTTVLLTTHYLDEAEAADRVAILDQGRLVAVGSPEALRAEIGGDSLILETDAPAELASQIQSRFGLVPRVLGDVLRLEVTQGHRWVVTLMEAFPGKIRALRLGQPTLEDVFVLRTGHRFDAPPALN